MSTCVYKRAWWASQGQQIIPVNFSCPFLLVLGFLMISLCFQIEVINSDPHRRDLRRGESGDRAGVCCFPQKLQLEKNSRIEVTCCFAAPARAAERKVFLYLSARGWSCKS